MTVNKPLFQKILFANAAFVLFIWNLLFAIPVDVLSRNSLELAHTSPHIVLTQGVYYGFYFLVVLNGLLLVTLTLSKGLLQQFILFLFFAFSISSWLNATFLVGTYGVFDGRNHFKVNPLSVLSFAQIAVFFILWLVSVFFRKRLKLLTTLVSLVLLISILVSAPHFFSKTQKSVSYGSPHDFATYSSNHPNVVMILLDEYQRDFFLHILNDKMEKSLKGFVLYKDAVSNFPTTLASVPALMAHEIYTNRSMSPRELFKKAKPKNLTVILQKEGVKVIHKGLFPMMFSKGDLHLPIYEEELFQYLPLVRYSIFRIAPDLLKGRLYDGQRWQILSLKKTNFKDQNLFQLHLVMNLKPIVKKDYPPTLKYFHSKTTHSPVGFDEQCNRIRPPSSNFKNKSAEGACTMKQVLALIKNLRKAGVFDNTLFLIFSDHGSMYTPKNFLHTAGYPYSHFAATLLIKPLFRHDAFTVDNYPALLSDIPKTVMEALHKQHTYGGVNLLSHKRAKPRIRIVDAYNWSNNWKKVPPPRLFKIQGPSNSPRSWSRVLADSLRVSCRKKYLFSQITRSGAGFFAKSFLFSQDKSLIFSNISFHKKRSLYPWLVIYAQKNCHPKAIKFHLTTYVAKNKEQTASVYVTASVYINNHLVGKIKSMLGKWQRQELVFPIPAPGIDGGVRVRFVTDGDTRRKLGFDFVDMTLLKDLP